MRSKGTAQELEARRRLAAAKCGEGWTQVEVAAVLGVHPVTVAKWMARHRADGDAGRAAKPTPGRPRFLTPVQERQVLRWLDQKPTAHGFRTDLWTSRRVTPLVDAAEFRAYGPHPAARNRPASNMEPSLPSPLSLRPLEAAKRLGVSPRTLWAWTRAGIIPCVKVGTGKRKTVLYPLADLQAWLTARAKGVPS